MPSQPFRKAVSLLLTLLLIFSLFPPALLQAQADTPSANLTTVDTVSNSVYEGNTFRVNINIAGVTDSVYQSVYKHQATVQYNPELLELTGVVAPYNTFDNPIQTELEPGKLAISTKIKDGKPGYAFANGTAKFAGFVFKAKKTTDAATVKVTGISVSNAAGDQLDVADETSTAITILPAGSKTALTSSVEQANLLHDSSTEGTLPGQYPTGSKAVLKTAIAKANNYVKTGSKAYGQAELDQARVTLEAAVATFKASVVAVTPPTTPPLQDGNYTVDFLIYKKGTNDTSVMYSYVDAASGKLTVQGGKKYVSFLLKQSREINGFKTEQGGQYVPATVLSSDEAANTRTVQFEVSDLNARKNAWVKIDWDALNYHHEYEVEIGLSNLKPTTPPVTPGQAYTLAYSVLHGTEDKASSMDAYFLKPGKLTVQGNQKKVSFTVKDSTTVPSFKIEKNGSLVETATISTDAAANTRVIEFEVADLAALVNGQVHVSTKLPNGTPYEKDHPIRLKFDVGVQAPLTALVAAAEAQHSAAAEGTLNGQYPAGSKNTLRAAIDAAKAVNANPAASAAQVTQAVQTLQAAVDTFAASVIKITPPTTPPLQDGNYTVDFVIYKKGTNDTSVMYSYVDAKSGKLTVQGGKKYVSFLLKQSREINGFKTEQGGQYVPATVLSSDEAANTRTVQFEVSDLNARKNAWVKIDWDALNYHHEYEVEIGLSNLKPTTPPVTPGQTYTLAYSVLHGTEDKVSSMDAYFLKPGKLTVQGNQKKVSFTVKDSTTVPSFKIEKNGSLVETATISTDAAANTRVIEFEVADLAALVNGQVHVSTKLPNGTPYEKDHPIRLKFDVGVQAPLTALVAAAEAQHSAAAEGTLNGQYPAGSKSTLRAAIDAAKAVNANPAASAAQVTQAVQTLQAAVDTFAAAVIKITPPVQVLQDGKYTVDFVIYKKGTNDTSVMYSYVDAASGKLTVQGGKKYVSFLLKQSREINGFKTEQGGQYVPATVLSSDEAANTRTVQFEVSDLNARKNAWVKIDWDALNYHHEYEVEIAVSNPMPETSQLAELIQQAQTKLDAAVEGEAEGQYPAGSKQTLKTAIASAQTVLKNATSGSTPLKDAVVQLRKQLAEFLSAVKLKTGAYVFQFAGTPLDGKPTPLGEYLNDAGKITVDNNGKKSISFNLKNGFTVAKLQKLLPDGTLANVGTPLAAVEKRHVVTILSVSPAKEVKYEIDDLHSIYVLNLASAAGGDADTRTFQIKLDKIAYDNTSGTPGNGNSGGGGGGGTPSIPTPVPTNIHGLADGTYTINYRILKVNTEDNSMMQTYVVTPGTLTVTGGQMYVSFTLKQSKEINSFKVEYDGSLNETETASSDAKENTRVVKFRVADLTKKTKGWVKIDWPEVSYHHTYDVQLTFDKSSVVRTGDAGSGAGGQTPTNTTPALATQLKAGDYQIGVKVKDRNPDQTTSFIDELIQHPALLRIEGGKSYVFLTFLKNKEVTKFAVQDNTFTFLPSQEITPPADPNTKVFRLEARDFHAKTRYYAQIGVDVPGKSKSIYEVQLVFDENSIKEITSPGTGTTSPNGQNNGSAGNTGTGKAPAWADIQGHWARSAIEQAVALQVVNGYEDGQFRPDAPVTRAEFAAMLSRTLKLAPSDAALDFADAAQVPAWAKTSLSAAVQAGLLSGYEDRTLRPDRQISRAELAVIISRAAGLAVGADAKLSFVDAADIPAWALPHVAAAHRLGIISGLDDQTFKPHDQASRAQAVKLLLAVLDAKAKK